MYCPKCDMDFVDGVLTCTDCGGELVDKAEYMLKMKAEAEAKAEADKIAREKEIERMNIESSGNADPEAEDISALTNRRAALRQMSAESATYVHQKDKYTDNKSSAAAFVIVGLILAVIAVLAWIRIIQLGMPFTIAATSFAALCIVLALITNIKADRMKGSIKEEDSLRDDVFNRFLEAHTAEEIDAGINRTDLDAEFNDEEVALERLNVIQDMLTIDNDIPDASFAAEIAEDLYAKIFE